MSFELSLDEGTFLVKLARRAITEYLKTGREISVPEDTPKKLFSKSGIFVTLNSIKGGFNRLRGCIGMPYPTLPLVEATIDSAISSATRDPRFPPVTLDELGSIIIELSILTPPQLIRVGDPKEYPDKIKIGRDGLIIERGIYKGLLLPQVPIEWHWDAEEFLANCCLKAGLAPDYWLIKGTRIYKFQAIIFEEVEPGGKVERRVL